MCEKVIGTIQKVSRYYVGGEDRAEVAVEKCRAAGLPFADGHRVPVVLKLGNRTYMAGLRADPRVDHVWICPDLLDGGTGSVSLTRALYDNGFREGQNVVLEVEEDCVRLLPG